MQYKALRPVVLNSKEYAEGAIVEVDDKELAEKLVARGTLGDAKGGSESTTPLAATPPASESPEPEAVAVEEVQPPQTSEPTPEQIEETLKSLDGSQSTSNEDQTS